MGGSVRTVPGFTSFGSMMPLASAMRRHSPGSSYSSCAISASVSPIFTVRRLVWSGELRGFYWVPEVNDEVLIAFERGEAHRPYVIGTLWNGKDKPMKDAFNKDNSTRMIQTKSGHQVILEDKKDAEKIIIADKSGKRTVTWDVKGKKFLIEAKEGDVEIHADKKIVLDCEDLEIKTNDKATIDIGKTLDVNVSDKATFKAGPQFNIKASRVNIN